MPTINKKGRPQRKYVKTYRDRASSALYNTTNWKKLREAYLMEHPLCEMCLRKGILSPTEEIHHISPISQGKDELDMKYRAYNPGNLMALCKKCHHELHNHQK